MTQKTIRTSSIFLVAVLLLFSSLVSPTAAAPVAVGDPAPFFTLADLGDRYHALGDYKGKVVFINFWASWCEPCRKELPLLDELQRAYPHQVVVLAVNIDQELANVRRFLRKYPINCNILLDSVAETASLFGVQAMPASYIVDQQGVVRYQHRGFNSRIDPRLWRQEIERLLGTSI